MSSIATVAAVLSLATASAAPAATVDLRSPDAATPVQFVTQQDLRSPDAATPVVQPSIASTQATTHDGSVSTWALVALIAAGLAACGLLAVMLRRHFEVGRPLGA